MAGFGLMCICHMGWPWLSCPPPAAPIPRGSLPPPRTPSESALRQAKQWQLRAHEDAFQQVESLEAWDPRATEGYAWHRRLKELLAKDSLGYFRQARGSAHQAVRLAGCSEEIYWATRQLTSIECALSDHQAEIRYARQLMALQPRRADSLSAMRNAARCNGLTSLERQMEDAQKARYAAMDAAQADQRLPHPAGQSGEQSLAEERIGSRQYEKDNEDRDTGSFAVAAGLDDELTAAVAGVRCQARARTGAGRGANSPPATGVRRLTAPTQVGS
jgi:hypothetical protein